MYVSELYLAESFLKKQTVSIDLDKFMSKRSNKLLIVGLTGSGKTTLAKYLEKKLKVKVVHLDDCTHPIYKQAKGNVNSKTMRYISDKCLIQHLQSRDRLIIEGSAIPQVYKDIPELRKLIISQPVIIIGKSLITSVKGAFMKHFTSQLEPEYKNLIKYYKINTNYIGPGLSKFRKKRIKVPGAKVEPYAIPVLKG